ncbi:unnamed protein product [Tuber melanosporum]|uniref:FK506-binding protein n=1 Tax=Tuber melanosporum (strain Mel28) TaxID=656061 RepID=D5GFH8_TUBMM|nr:uncharacterized protein GSTUM_00006906001 [Tuber melanosporum]CAZ83271.1 unnamed protein product [Tuber melanosporum]
MSSLLPIALWSLHVSPGQSPVPAVDAFPATVRLTMAAIDPSAKPYEAGKPKRATLKFFCERIVDPDDDSDDDLGEASDEEEKEVTKSSLKGKQSPKSKTSNDDAMDAESSDDDLDSSGEDTDSSEVLESFVVCTLDSDKHYQQTLDLVIGDDELVYFKVDGNYDVYLTGNYVVSPGDAYKNNGEADGDYDLSPDEDELYSDEETDSDELDDLDDPPRIQEVDTDEEEAVKASKAAASTNCASKKDKRVEKVDKKADKKSLKRPAEDEEPRTIDEMIEGEKILSENKGEAEKKLSKKQLKKLKANDGKAVELAADSKAKEAKKVQFAKELEQGPTGSPVTAEKKEKKIPSAKRVIQGVTVMDSKVGTGDTAKKGSKLCMRYIGKLENGKIFDSNTKGKPFAFQLGKGEVIKGWDVGLEGMRVGGERRLNIPAALGYGKQNIPGIPANSNLIFDVKLTDIE